MRLLGPIVLAGLLLGAVGGAALAEERTVLVNIAGGGVAKQLQVLRFRQGDHVRLRWTSDRPIEIHLHGYDVLKTVEPGQLVEMAFEANIAGRFPVSEHVRGGTEGHSHRALLRVEVLPP